MKFEQRSKLLQIELNNPILENFILLAHDH